MNFADIPADASVFLDANVLPLIPKLQLGNLPSSKLCLVIKAEAELPRRAFPSRSLGSS